MRIYGKLLIVLLLLPVALQAQYSCSTSGANYEIVDKYDYPGYQVVQINLGVLAHYSYFLISNGEAAVVDPGRDIFSYLKWAEQKKVKIKAVLLTHSHADFVAGHMELAKAAGCPIYISKAANAGYAHRAMNDGDTLKLGNIQVKFVATPGHTPDSMCVYVYSKAGNAAPEAIFSGDTLFVGSVGRPDLLEGNIAASTLASMMYDSWTQKLAKLPDSTVVYPAHGAGSLCGAHLGDSPYTTIGQEKKTNSYVKNKARSRFIAAILDELPGAPQYFGYNAAMNRKGPELIDWKKQPKKLKPSKELTDPSKYYVVDVRQFDVYAAGHIPNSVNIGLAGKIETWVGMMVPWGSNLVLCGSAKEIDGSAYRLHRIGYKAQGILFDQWKTAGLPLAKSQAVAPKTLEKLRKEQKAPILLDVRKPEEWRDWHIPEVVNFPLQNLEKLSGKLDKGQPVLTACRSGYRAAIAVGLLERKGIKSIGSLIGGGKGWKEAGLPVIEGKQAGHAVSPKPVKYVRLPERISASALKRMLMDMPGAFDLVDIRPAQHFEDFHLPQSRNIQIAELLENESYLKNEKPLVIVDRDGSLAMAVGGILSQKTKRSVKVLYGGLQSYWNEIEARPYITPGVPSKSDKSEPKPAVKPARKKRSAGC